MVRERTKQKAEEAVILLEVQGTEALRQQKQKEGGSLAMLIEEKNKAEAVRVNAEVGRKNLNRAGGGRRDPEELSLSFFFFLELRCS